MHAECEVHPRVSWPALPAGKHGRFARPDCAARIHHCAPGAGRGGRTAADEPGHHRVGRVHLERHPKLRSRAPDQAATAKRQNRAGRPRSQPRDGQPGDCASGRPRHHRLGRPEFCQIVPRAVAWAPAAHENHGRRAAAAGSNRPALRRIFGRRPGAPPAVCRGLTRLPLQVRILLELARQNRLGV